jgi:hypothetical protein
MACRNRLYGSRGRVCYVERISGLGYLRPHFGYRGPTVQTRRFSGFSYADIAAELNITKASLPYHFPTKVMLEKR